ncbi:hypothetical protein J7T55_012255 [Diaporthe amygdali]|uniref:uncharacterized protein n=1 Tax=Phomopsis amygdali TaxID=1214568 RepID=UPI0022FE85ED|nr:uncharacterized protein J7T55_012255 [Diaporthe amygdali]KAJ0123786.1 hypothetical protein J7T55_012255 [Diaporthe amygdali]
MREDATDARAPYMRLNVSACFDYYSHYFTPQGNGFLFVKNQSIQYPPNDSLLLYVSVIPRRDDWAKNLWAFGNGTFPKHAKITTSRPSPVKKWLVGKPAYEVDHCLVQQPPWSEKRCQLEYSPWILWACCLSNLIKLLVMISIWFASRRSAAEKGGRRSMSGIEQPLCTLGDAIASFMRKPDHTTEGMSTTTMNDFQAPVMSRHFGPRNKQSPHLRGPRPWYPGPKQWRHAVSLERWLWFLLGLKLRHISTSVSSFWSMGLGELRDYTFIYICYPRDDPWGLISNVLLANIPQLVASIFYLSYNGMLTMFLVQFEFSSMYKTRKSLRVSEPAGTQRSSYPISLPFRYGIPLSISSGVMSWLLSQSLFLARITALHPDGTSDRVNSFSSTGYSPIAIFFALLLATVQVVAVLALSLRKYTEPMSLVSTNSRAISAACHVLPEEVKDSYLLPIRWAVVEVDEFAVRHCAFTTKPDSEIHDLEPGRLYR